MVSFYTTFPLYGEWGLQMTSIDEAIISFLKNHKCSESEKIIRWFKKRAKSKCTDFQYYNHYDKYCAIDRCVNWAQSEEGYLFYYFLQLRLLILAAYLNLENGCVDTTKDTLSLFLIEYGKCRTFSSSVDVGNKRFTSHTFYALRSLYMNKYEIIRGIFLQKTR